MHIAAYSSCVLTLYIYFELLNLNVVDVMLEWYTGNHQERSYLVTFCWSFVTTSGENGNSVKYFRLAKKETSR